ncbi:MAG: transposase [Planctomycetota bacterium]|jgi:putative transposase
MPRTNRVAPGGWVFHVLNRANALMQIFDHEEDYRAFERVLNETINHIGMRLLAYCVMPNHWHIVLWPRHDGDLGRFMQRLTTTHVRRWHLHRNSVGTGHLYQGIYKSFPIQQDEHFLTVCRYVERNALRANLVARAEDWSWSSLAVSQMSASRCTNEVKPPISDWPVDRPRGWQRLVNVPQTDEEVDALSRAVQRGRPYGTMTWQKRAAIRLGLGSTMRPRGRPRLKSGK